MIYKRRKVLIVDDDNAVCSLICDGLAEEGYICDATSNADDAKSDGSDDIKPHSLIIPVSIFHL